MNDVPSSSVAVQFVGDPATLFDSFKAIADRSDEVADGVATAFTGAGDKIGETFEALTGKVDGSFGDVAGASDDVGESMVVRWQEVADSIAASMAAACAKIDASLAATGAKSAEAGAAASAGGAAKGAKADTPIGDFGGKVALGVVALGAAAVYAGVKYQDLDAHLAATEGVSIKFATNVGNAINNLGGTTEYTSNQMMEAFTPMSAKFADIQGHVLTAAQSVQVMKNAADLATASGESLTNATADLANVMQAYGMKVGQSRLATDILYNTSKILGISIDAVTAEVDKLHSKLGVLAPSLGQTAGMFADMAHNGLTGKAAVTAYSNAITTLMGPTQALQDANRNATTTTKDLANAYSNGQITQAQYAAELRLLPDQQQKYAAQIVSANQSIAEQGNLTLDVKGKFVGWASVIDQLKSKMADMSKAQRLAYLDQVFGKKTGGELYATIEAGSGKYDKYSAAVSKSGSAHKAAAKIDASLQGQLKELESALVSMANKVGAVLVPVLTTLVTALKDVFAWFEKHKTIAAVLAGVIGVVLGGAVALFAAKKLGELKKSLSAGIDEIKSFGKGLSNLVGHFTSAGKASDTMAKKTATDAATDKTSMTKMGNASKTMATDVETSTAAAETDIEGVGTTSTETAGVMETAGEEGGAGMDAMLGPIGLVIMAGTFLASHWKEVKKILDKVWDGIKDGVKAAFDWIKNLLSTIIPIIITVITGPIGLLVYEIVKHWHTIESDAKKVWGDILSFLESVPKKILGFFAGALKWLVNVGKNIMKGLIKGLEDGIGDLAHAVDNIAHHILHGLEHPFGLSDHPSPITARTGGNIMKGLVQGLGQTTQLIGVFDKAIASIHAQLNPLPVYFRTVGEEMAKGLTDGLKVMIPELKLLTAEALLATRAISGVEHLLGIGGGARSTGGLPTTAGSSVTNNWNLDHTTIQANNPAQLEQQLTLRSRRKNTART